MRRAARFIASPKQGKSKKGAWMFTAALRLHHLSFGWHHAPTRSSPGMRPPLATLEPVADFELEAHIATSSGAHLDVMVLGCV
eukprot:354545-Chlamydomonas_euryale.AAC.2